MAMRERGAVGVPWWLFLVTGVAWLLIAMVVLRFNLSSVSTVGVLLGIVLLMAGVNEFVAMGTRPGWKWLYVLMGVLFIGGGIWALVNPIGAFYELAAILGFLLVLKGAFDISLAFMIKDENDLWWLSLVVGILEILLAFWVSQQFFAPRAALILLWVGFAALFRGVGEIFMAFSLRRMRTDIESLRV